MRSILAWAAVALVVSAAAANAGSIGVGVGAFGGVSIPVLNDLAKQGPQYGVRVPVKLVPMVTVEPFWLTTTLGDFTETVAGIDYSKDGGDLGGFGLNALLTLSPGAVRFYPYAGLGTYTLKQEGAADLKKGGYQFGLGFGFHVVPKLSADIRGELMMLVTDQTSRKFGNINAGLSYDLF